jgi:sulfur carrier protein ThiS adenylyltransferase
MPSTDAKLADRDACQRDLVPPDKLARCHAVVIGVGAVGRQVALQLAAAGVPAMTMYDPDTVGVESLAVQGYWETDVGDPKVHAVANVCHQQFPRMALHARRERFRRSAVRSWPADRNRSVFCCVDSIATRKLVWDAIRGVAGFFADGRMAAEVVRVLVSNAPAADAGYATTLFAPGEAYAGGCTAKSTIYAASVAAGLMVGQFARWLRGQPVLADQTLNLLAGELSVADLVR